MYFVIIVFLMMLLIISLALRMKRGHQGVASNEVRATPFSLAVQELVSTAGGVYLSLIMLTSFLKIDIPEIIYFASVGFDPLAGIAMGIALIQPLCAMLLIKLTK